MSDALKEARTRTITWEDPRALAAAGSKPSGLEFLEKIVAGHRPTTQGFGDADGNAGMNLKR